MYSPPKQSSRSPPPLQHPIPTHPPRHVPDPPVTPTPTGAASGATDGHQSSARSRAGGSGGGGGGVGYGQQGGGSGSRLGAVPTGATAQYARYSSPPTSQPSDQNYDAYGAPQPAGHSFGSAISGDMGSAYGGASNSYGAGSQGGNNFYGGPRGGPPQAGPSSFGNQFGNFLGGDPNVNMTAQMGMHFGQQMASVGGDYVQKNVSDSSMTWVGASAR